jgi:hypothetical protein
MDVNHRPPTDEAPRRRREPYTDGVPLLGVIGFGLVIVLVLLSLLASLAFTIRCAWEAGA